MDKKQSGSKATWAGTILYLIITAAHAWYLHGFIPVAGLIFLSFIGGILFYFGLKKLVSSVFAPPVKVWSIIAGLLLLAFGALTLIPGWPDRLLLKTPIGWPILEYRSKLLDRAMYEDNLQQVRKIAWAGLGDPAPRDSFGRPLIDDAKNPEMLRILLDSGLDPDARAEGGTTLLMRTHDEDMAGVLLAAGADPNARDDNGRTPLMYVADTNLELVKVLADNGAQVNASDDFGRTVADWLDSNREIDNVLAAYAHGEVRRGTDLDFLSHARRDWLDPKSPDSKSPLKPSAISVNPDPLTYGDLAELQIRLSNDSDIDRVVKVEVNLNSEALFVDTSHDGKIINPYQPQLNQEIGWPLLALPAHSSGILEMTIIIRDDWGAGDLFLDVRARNVLNHSDEENIFLTLNRALSETIDSGAPLGSLLGALVIPLPIVIWLLAWRFLGKKHLVTRGAGRLTAGFFSILCAVGAYSSAIDLVRPYSDFVESEALILDRRYYLESTTTSSGSGRSSRSTTVTYAVPIVAARYATLNGEVISTGPASEQFFRENKLGAFVPCWYDPDNPGKFIVVREISFLTIIGIGMFAVISPVLAWIALRRRKKHELSHV